MSFWSMQGAQRAAVLLAMLLTFTYQVDGQMTEEPQPASAASARKDATPAHGDRAANTSAPSRQDQADGENGPGLGTYLCLLACAIVVGRQIRKRGKTHITLS